MKRFLKIALAVVVVLLLGAGGLFASAFAGHAAIEHGQQLNGVEVIKDGYVACYLVDAGNGQVVLVDACNDTKGAPILKALEARKLGPTAVKAILLTHGDYDHTAGALAFPNADLMVLEPDIALAEGRAVRSPLASGKPNGLKVTRALADGETVQIGEARFEVFAIPGHTPGSAAFLHQGVLFMGDSAESTGEGQIEGCMWLFCGDRKQSHSSVARLAERLAPRAADVRVIAPSHSGAVSRGLAPLADFAKAN